MKFYAGIGSRETPSHIQRVMTSLAKELCQMGYTLRSGNAEGADQAFACGVLDDKAQIWLPWESFNIDFQVKHSSHTYKTVQPTDREAWESIEQFHPAPNRLGQQGIKLMARNYRQVVGFNEPNSEFVVCWTTDGKELGGTAQAIKIARHFKIPVYNLYDFNKEEVLTEIKKLNLLY